MRIHLEVVLAASLLVTLGCSSQSDDRSAAEAAPPPSRAEANGTPVSPDVEGGVDASAPPSPGSSPEGGAADATPTTKSCVPSPTSALTVNVKTTGAKGDGVTDDTLAIQSAIGQVNGSGGTVFVPDGTYMINATRTSGSGLVLGANMTLRLSPAAVLKVIPNGVDSYRLMKISGANVNVVGGTLEGERAQHTAATGEHGMGISLYGASNVVIEGVTIKEFWGDALYVASASQNVSLCDVVTDHNRRQGLSIIAVDGMVVKRSTFKNTFGTKPEAGIDFEPNLGDTINDVQVLGCVTENNGGDGFQIGVPGANKGQAFITNVTIEGNSVRGNGKDAANPSYGLEISGTSNNLIKNNVIENNTGDGIILRNGAVGNVITGNTITGNTKHGIYDLAAVNNASGNVVSGNGIAP
jgi:parallel beta-helix repeat protein